MTDTQPATATDGVGAAPKRFDAYDKVTGAAGYPADLCPPGALWAMPVFSDRPHARMLSFDKTNAEALDGVVVVVTAADD